MEDTTIGDAFRLAMRRLAGGVAIVTSSDTVDSFGMTMTAVMSLAMEPPSLVIAVNRNASLANVLSAGRQFCVNLLDASQQPLCEQFSTLPHGERFQVGHWEHTPEHTPYLPDAAAAIFCRVGPMHDFGTHRMVIGTVEQVRLGAGIDPLLHLDGQYRRTAPAQ